MSHKKQLIGLDFERRASLLAPVLASESVVGVSVAPDGSLLYDGTLAEHNVYARLNGQWRGLLSTANLSADTNFNVAGGLLATRDTIRQYVESVLTSVGGTFQGSWNASAGTVPSGAGIKAGDSWRISVGGTLTGLPGATTVVEPGDLIVASIDNPTGPADFFALQTNISDSSQIIVGGTFNPQAGPIAGTDSVKVALQKLRWDIEALAASAVTNAGNGLVYDIVNQRINVDLAANSGLEFTATDGTGQLRLKGLADYSASTGTLVAIGVDSAGNVVIDAALLTPDFSTLAGDGLLWNATDNRLEIDLAPNSGLELTATDGNGYLTLKGLADYSAFTSTNLIPLGYDSSGNLVTSSQGIADAVAGSGLSYNTTTNKIDLGGVLTNTMTVIEYDAAFNPDGVVQIKSSSGSNRSWLSTSTGFAGNMTNASMQAENSIFLSVATAYVDNSGTYYEILSGTSTVWSRLKVVGEGYFLQSSLPEYTLPTAGNKFGLAIDSTGKVVFESPANLSASIKYTQSITGNATATSFAVTHNKATKDVVVQVFDVDTDDEVDVSISRSTLDVVEVIFAAAPATGKQYRVVVI